MVMDREKVVELSLPAAMMGAIPARRSERLKRWKRVLLVPVQSRGGRSEERVGGFKGWEVEEANP
ncbi:hypothetical protein SESBI_14337 [Sesbania bispinosa]|nr:hypothetical protein SESBI_14337 [Sesbania bispinosa]